MVESSMKTRRRLALTLSLKAHGRHVAHPSLQVFSRTLSNIGYCVLELLSGKTDIKAAAVKKSTLHTAFSSVNMQPMVFHTAENKPFSLQSIY